MDETGERAPPDGSRPRPTDRDAPEEEEDNAEIGKKSGVAPMIGCLLLTGSRNTDRLTILDKRLDRLLYRSIRSSQPVLSRPSYPT